VPIDAGKLWDHKILDAKARSLSMDSTRTQASLVLLIICFMVSSACALVTPAPLLASRTPLSPTQTMLPVTETFTPLPPATSTNIPTATPVPLNLSPQIILLAEDFLEPDDLVLAPDGSVYISDVTEGTIKQYTPQGQLNLILSGLSAPEGMAFLPDGSLIIAEQGNNRLIRYDFQSKTMLPFLDLPNRTNNLGVDGIIWNGSNLIVPDSPNGTVLEVSVDGKTVRQLASGMVRPTGAWAEPDGNLLIADEYGNAIVRLYPDGTLEKIADFSIPDDVIEDPSGNIFVVTLGDNAIHVITAQNKEDVILVNGLADPQGLIFDLDGNLIVTDSGHHQLLKILIH
jgi:sugar lactone lactonase YvrE